MYEPGNKSASLERILTWTQQIPQDNRLAQKPLAAAHDVSPYGFAAHQPMQAASEAGSAERPIGKMVAAVIVSGILFGLGMGI